MSVAATFGAVQAQSLPTKTMASPVNNFRLDPRTEAHRASSRAIHHQETTRKNVNNTDHHNLDANRDPITAAPGARASARSQYGR
jgi:hypothetical protein